MTRIAPLLLCLILTSPLLTGAAGSSVLCSRTKLLPDGEVRVTFLRRSSASLRLYQGVWSASQRALLACAWSDDPAAIRNFLSLCPESSHPPEGNLHVDSVLQAEELCVPVASPLDAKGHQGEAGRSKVRTHQRAKRGFIVPGTLWCGSGNKAPSYADLGVFSDTDSCCREHDQCKHTILSFHSGFGVFNSNIFTMSHCDCDNKFHRCLMEAKDSISNVVGYTFFNLLKMHCFQFSHRLQCTERNWFGMCKETKMALYAEVHPPRIYESPATTEVGMNSSVVNATVTTEISESIVTAASTVPTPLTSSASITDVTKVTKVTASVSGRPTGSDPVSADHLENTLPTKTQAVPELEITETKQSCDVYRDLDKCSDKILPQQKRYGLQNPETRTLYHCNCTNRLFQILVKQRQLSEVQALLLGRVSQSCFLQQDCPAGETCPAVLVRAELPQLVQRSRAGMEEWRHLQAITLKVRRPNIRRAKRKDPRLYKLCVRMVQPRLNQSQSQTRTRPEPWAKMPTEHLLSEKINESQDAE